MGVVYAAYDPELDRRVALKLLHPRRTVGRNAADEGRRLLREAQAIARVNHPNVIAIHDVGEHEGGVFLAMEYIDGPTLAQWLQERARTIAEVTAVFAAAARGLAAAHAKDLVHRDFKPDNVMLDDEGRVRVLDFGLVLGTGLSSEPLRDDGIVGTPAYMAPEQLAGRPTDARSDQFAFCVALHEAVYRVRPFAGRDLVALTTAITTGAVLPAPAGSAVPTWLRRVILRGLAVDRDQRWPDMNAVVAALTEDRTARSRTLAVAGIGAALAAGAIAIAFAGDSDADADRCARIADDHVWDTARRDALESVVVGDASEFRRDTWTRVATLLDARAESLRAATNAACLAAPNDALAAARQLCVARHRRELDATITALLDADLGDLVSAVPAVEAVSDAMSCDDAAALGNELAPPADAIADRVQQIRDELARAFALGSLGDSARGYELALAAGAEARALGYRPLVAEAGRTLGLLQGRMVRYAESEATLREAFAIAVEVGHDRLAVSIAAALTRVVGESQARPREALVWGEIGRALVRRGPWIVEDIGLGRAIAAAHFRDGDPRAALAELERAKALGDAAALGPDGNLLRDLSDIYRSIGDADGAMRAIDAALEVDMRRLGPDHPTVAQDIAALAASHLERGEHAIAVRHFERAIAILERALGPDTERLSAVLANMAAALGTSGDYDAALPPLARALAISTAALGADHPDTLETAMNLATLHLMRGDAAESVRLQLELLPRFERRLGAEHPSVSALLANLGSAEAELERYADALVHLERAVAIAERALGSDHVELANALYSLGDTYLSSGNAAQALPLLERALGIYESKRGLDHVDVSWPALAIGIAALELGDTARAIAMLQRAVSLREAGEVSASARGEARFHLARALWSRPEARAEAIALANRAAEDASADPKLAAKIASWLAEPR
jgi:tetratricopeptide (TPR) repeat protein